MSDVDAPTAAAAAASGGEGASRDFNATFVVKSKARELNHRILLRKKEEENAPSIEDDSDEWLATQAMSVVRTPDGDIKRNVIAFGKIKFPQITRCPKYVVVPEDVTEGFIERLIIDQWGLPEPNMIISYVGDDKMFLNPKWRNLKKYFQKAIVEQTQSCGGWVLTEGLCCGMTQRVGKAMSIHGSHQSGIHKAYCVGVVPMSSIVKTERASLLKGRGEERHCMVSQKCDRMIATRRRHYLDAYHTHYVLIDDTKNETDGDETFAAARELTRRVHQRVVDAAGKESPVSWILQNQQRFRISDFRPTDKSNGKSRVAPLLYIAFLGPKVDCDAIKEMRDTLDIVNASFEDQDADSEVKLCGAVMLLMVSDEPRGFGQLVKACCDIKSEKTKSKNSRRLEVMPQVAEYCARTDLDLDESMVESLTELNLYAKVNKVLWVVNAVDITSADVFCDKMVETFFRVHKRYETRLALSVFWNQLDMAEKHVFQMPDFRWVPNELDLAVYYAILYNKVDFLRVFAKNGFDVEEFLNIFRLTELYNDIAVATLHESSRMLLAYLIYAQNDRTERKKFFKADPGLEYSVIGLRHIGELLTFFIGEGDTLHPYRSQSRYSASGAALYAVSDDATKDRQFARSVSLTAAYDRVAPPAVDKRSSTVNKMFSRSDDTDEVPQSVAAAKIWRFKEVMRNWDSGPFMSEERLQLVLRGSREGILEVSHFDNPAVHLFVYAVLLNRREQAMLFFEDVQDALPAALMASKVLKKMALICKDRRIFGCIPEALHVNLNDEMNDYLNSAVYFEQIAYDMLTVCYDTYQIPSADVLLRPVPVFGNVTTFELALSADNRLFCARKFVAHPGFQAYLDLTWLGRVHDSHPIAVMLSCLCIPALFFLDYDTDGSNDVPGSLDLNAWVKGVNCTKKPEKKVVYDENGEEEVPVNVRVKNDDVGFLAKITYFFNAPIVTYIYHFAAHLVLLVLLSYDFVILYASGLYWLDYLLMVWILQHAFEEIRQCVTMKGKPFDKVIKYFGSSWKAVEICGMVSFAIAIYINVGIYTTLLDDPTADTTQMNFTGRVFYSICIMMYYSKTLYFFTITSTLGPTVIFIKRMLGDLFAFVCILLIFYIMWGVVQYGLLWPNSTAQWTLIRDILVMPFWQMFGGSYTNVIGQQPFEEADMLASCTTNSTIYDTYGAVRCTDPQGRILIPILLAFYMFILNLLMINILIAIFNDTFATLKDKMREHWSFQRCEILLEYYYKPPLAPPLLFICHLYWLFSLMARHEANRVVPQDSGDTEQLTVVINPPTDDAIEEDRSNDDPEFKVE